MGCCNSKPKTKEAPPSAVAPPKPVEPVKEPIPEEKQELKIEDPYLRRIRAIHDARKGPFRYNKCTIGDGVVSPLLEEGVVYRIVKDDMWFIYNDSLQYEAHLEHSFGPDVPILPGERTFVENAEDGGQVAKLVVYPLETIHYISGAPAEYTGSVLAKPLSEDYLEKHCADANAQAAEELEAAKATSAEGANAAAVLAGCVRAQKPFVDPDFPPTPRMLYRPEIDGHALRGAAMKRPSQFLEGGEEAAPFTDVVVPQVIEPGVLGDCWFTSAVAVLAEREDAVRAIFANVEPSESALGAYRVVLNKSGWWGSVLVDDYLPTIANRPVFASSEDVRELWVGLLQKAYAKLHGSYAAITGGDALQALQDLTGAPVQRFDEEWAAAGKELEDAQGLFEKFAQYLEAGCLLVLSTPSLNQLRDPAAEGAKYAAVGLELAHTYHLERALTINTEGGDEFALLKVRNPWDVKGRWTGPWSAGSKEWGANPAAVEACDLRTEEGGPREEEEEEDDTFWIALEDALEYFNGGGVVFTPARAVDYRVRGTFRGVEPSVVLKVTATERVGLLLVLSQQDKRGLPADDVRARFAPLMLSVVKHDGEKYLVERNSSLNPAFPSEGYNFAVARDVALRYTFEPSANPYLVIPRLHSKGVVEGFDRPFVLGVLSSGPIDDAVSIELTHLGADHVVFQNIRRFAVDGMPLVEAEHQKHLAGQLPITATSNRVCGVEIGDFMPSTVVQTRSPSSSRIDKEVEKEEDTKVEKKGEEMEFHTTSAKSPAEEDIEFKTHENTPTIGQDTEVHRVG